MGLLVTALCSRPTSAILGLLVHPCGSDLIEEGLGCRPRPQSHSPRKGSLGKTGLEGLLPLTSSLLGTQLVLSHCRAPRPLGFWEWGNVMRWSSGVVCCMGIRLPRFRRRW